MLRFLAVGLSAIGLSVAISIAGRAADSNTSLADAAERQDASSVRALVESGADIHAPQVDGMTALHWAVYHDNLNITKLLIDHGADVNAQNRYGVPPLSLACTNGNGGIVRLLLDEGADPNAELRGGESVLHTAARTGRAEPVRALIAAGADVDATERRGQTALMWAAADGHAEVVQALIEADADFLEPLESGFTPLFFAVREGHSDVVFTLLEAGADVNAAFTAEKASNNGPRNGTTPLILAVENGHFELAAALLSAGADPNLQETGFTALHTITWVRKPIRGDGDPPPIGSGDLSSLDIVRRLVEHGADVNARLKNGESGRGRFTTTGSTPFLMAARASDVPLMRLLLELGADPRVPNADDSPPLLAAAGVGALGDGDEAAGTEEEAIAAVSLLLELGADVNAVDQNGETAMHGAAYQSWAGLVRVLADNGADIDVWNRENRFGWTPLAIAVGHRPGNFRPAPATIDAIESVMRAHGVAPSRTPGPEGADERYRTQQRN